MESALIISPWSRFPISIASLDLPVPVAPRITTKDGAIALRKAHCTVRADAAMMSLPRRPADTPRACAVGVEMRDELCYQATGNPYFGNIMEGHVGGGSSSLTLNNCNCVNIISKFCALNALLGPCSHFRQNSQSDVWSDSSFLAAAVVTDQIVDDIYNVC